MNPSRSNRKPWFPRLLGLSGALLLLTLSNYSWQLWYPTQAGNGVSSHIVSGGVPLTLGELSERRKKDS